MAVTTFMVDSSTGGQINYCPHCSNPPVNYVYHSGKCPKVKSIEYHPDGTIKKIEFNE